MDPTNAPVPDVHVDPPEQPDNQCAHSPIHFRADTFLYREGETRMALVDGTSDVIQSVICPMCNYRFSTRELLMMMSNRIKVIEDKLARLQHLTG